AGDRIVGVGVRGVVAQELAGWLDQHTAAVAGYAPVVVTVERPQDLYLVYRGGALIARLRTLAEAVTCLEIMVAGYAAPDSGGDEGDGVAGVGCGAVWHPERGVVLIPNYWLSEVAKQSSRLRRAG